mgnify:CR=1 FL=1
MNPIKPQQFFEACVIGDPKTVKQFIQENQHDIDVKNEKGWTGLIMACFNENTEIAKLLIENGADINATNEKGTTVFMYAKTPIQSKQHDTNFLDYLLRNGADINAFDEKGKTVLDYVTENGFHELSAWMIKKGAKSGN